MWRIKPPPTGGRKAHPVFLSLCSPFLDIGAACPPPTLTTHHSIIATHVAPVCNGWNHRPAVSLGCFQHVKELIVVEDGGLEPPTLWVPYGNAVRCALAATYASPDALPTELISHIVSLFLSLFFKTSVLHSRLVKINHYL